MSSSLQKEKTTLVHISINRWNCRNKLKNDETKTMRRDKNHISQISNHQLCGNNNRSVCDSQLLTDRRFAMVVSSCSRAVRVLYFKWSCEMCAQWRCNWRWSCTRWPGGPAVSLSHLNLFMRLTLFVIFVPKFACVCGYQLDGNLVWRTVAKEGEVKNWWIADCEIPFRIADKWRTAQIYGFCSEYKKKTKKSTTIIRPMNCYAHFNEIWKDFNVSVWRWQLTKLTKHEPQSV